MFALRENWFDSWVESCASLVDAVLGVRASIEGYIEIVLRRKAKWSANGLYGSRSNALYGGLPAM